MKKTDYIVLIDNDKMYFTEKSNDHVLEVDPRKFTDHQTESRYEHMKRYIIEGFFPLFSGLQLFKKKLIKPTVTVYVNDNFSYFEREGIGYVFMNLGFRHVMLEARKYSGMQTPQEELLKYVNTIAAMNN